MLLMLHKLLLLLLLLLLEQKRAEWKRDDDEQAEVEAKGVEEGDKATAAKKRGGAIDDLLFAVAIALSGLRPAIPHEDVARLEAMEML